MSGKASESTQERLRFGDEKRNIVGDAVFAPDFHDAGDELGLVVEIAPLNFAGLEGIVFEREEGEFVDGVVGFQIVDEAAGPGSLAGSVGPGFDVFVDAGEDGAAEFEFGIDAVQGLGELDVHGGVIFGNHEVAVGFFAHFDVRDGIAALFKVSEFVGGVFRRAVNHGDGNHGGQAAGVTVGHEEKIEADLFAGVFIQITGLVPGIDGGAIGHGLVLIGSVADEIVELAVGGSGAEINFVDGVAEAVALVGGAVGVASVGGGTHEDANELRGDGDGGELEDGAATFAVGDGAAGEGLPNAGGGFANAVFAGEILDDEIGGVRFGPVDANGGNFARLGKIENDPLRMERIGFAGEMFRRDKDCFSSRCRDRRR